MSKAQNKYRRSKRGKFNERLNKRLRQWRRVYGYKTEIDFEEFIKKYSDCGECEYCGEKGVKLLFHLGSHVAKKIDNTIRIEDIDFICQKCLYNEIRRY